MKAFKNSYVCIGDAITWSVGGFDVTARIEEDAETDIADFDCYADRDVTAWCDDEWRFVGLVLSVSLGGVMLEENAASLWGIDCNFPGSDNAYLDECAKDLESEALDAARGALSRLDAARKVLTPS